MPKTRKPKSKRKRRKSSVPRSIPASPNKMVVKFKYAEPIQLSTTAGLTGVYTFKANDLYDPNHTSTGHQPYGYDQWALLFGHYTVLQSKISATFMSRQNDSSIPGRGICGITLEDDSSFTTNPSLAFEQQRTNLSSYGVLGSGMHKKLSKTYDAKKFWTIKDPADNPEIGSVVTTSPGDKAYFHVWVAPLLASDLIGALDILVEMEFIALMTTPQDLPQS